MKIVDTTHCYCCKELFTYAANANAVVCWTCAREIEQSLRATIDELRHALIDARRRAFEQAVEVVQECVGELDRDGYIVPIAATRWIAERIDDEARKAW
jgi:NMD protein affecting ribosome stability and mRNA decay